MKTFKFGTAEIKMYVSADELPIDRWTMFNKYLMLDGIIGNSFEDIENKHIRTMFEIIDDKPKLTQCLKNLRELIYNISSSITYQHTAFCTFIHSINNELKTDLSESGIQETLKQLAKIGLTNEDIKKKIIVRGNLSTVN